MRSNIGGVAVIALTLVAGFGTPLALAYQRVQASENLAARPLRATAQVGEVTRITQIDPFPCRPGSGSRCGRRNTMYDVAQPYDIVQLRLMPQGAAGHVIAVDAVDAAAGDSGFAPGAQVEVAYAPGAPRSAVILGVSHSHYWRNAVGFAIFFGALALLLAALLAWLLRRPRRARRAPEASPAGQGSRSA
jgi:hypothetical protein